MTRLLLAIAAIAAAITVTMYSATAPKPSGPTRQPAISDTHGPATPTEVQGR
jgi:hypothetical protein